MEGLGIDPYGGARTSIAGPPDAYYSEPFRVHGLTLISRMIQLEDGALSQTLVNRMTDFDFSFCAL